MGSIVFCVFVMLAFFVAGYLVGISTPKSKEESVERNDYQNY